MASVFDMQTLYAKKHGVAESTLMLATVNGAHFYNLVNDKIDIDNGSVAVIGDYTEQDLWKAVVPKKTDKVTLILTAPKIYEEYTTQMQEEGYFYNGAGEAMRAYEITETDRFTLSAEAFATDAEPEVGKLVVVQGVAESTDGFKLTTVEASTDVSGYGFVGQIYAVANNGGFRIFVKKNTAVATA